MDVVTLEETKKDTFFVKCAFWASILETMTLNVCLLCVSVMSETIIFVVWLFKHPREAAIMQLVISSLALLFFGSKIVLSFISYGIERYGLSHVCFLECSIFLLDGTSLVMSVETIMSPSKKKAIAYFAFFAAFLIFHSVRIFYIFYATARPPKLVDGAPPPINDRRVDKIRSITGIWVSRYFSNMNFAASDLVSTLENASSVFSLQFYGTREDASDPSITVKRGGHAIHAGRPDWEAIFHEAISKAHCTNPEGEAVGVFFCGAPAIARDLQRTAQKVTAQHQSACKVLYGSPCRCRLLVHKENF
jgi:hypothetical protein